MARDYRVFLFVLFLLLRSLHDARISVQRQTFAVHESKSYRQQDRIIHKQANHK